jgi:hypothetical protein
MAEAWGITIDADAMAEVRTEGDFVALVARTLDRRAARMRG